MFEIASSFLGLAVLIVIISIISICIVGFSRCGIGSREVNEIRDR